VIRKITFKGVPMTLVGRALKIGATAPDFRAVATDMKEMTLADFKGKIKVISSFPSLDTPVCDMQVKEFNKRAAGFSSDTAVLGISKDLPFAQKRFCSMNEIAKEVTLSDYKFSSFGINYGLLIRELNLLARSVLILDKNNVLRYFRIVEELTQPPDFEDALKNLEQVLQKPASSIKEDVPGKCVPCEGGVLALPKEKIDKLMAQAAGWQLEEEKRLVKKFKFKDFLEAKYFLDLISVIAEEQGHHPRLTLDYNRLSVALMTHAAGGLTENDFILARIIDELGGGEA
jgi:thioredoxin-dependent peroxiredoxin